MGASTITKTIVTFIIIGVETTLSIHTVTLVEVSRDISYKHEIPRDALPVTERRAGANVVQSVTRHTLQMNRLVIEYKREPIGREKILYQIGINRRNVKDERN